MRHKKNRLGRRAIVAVGALVAVLSVTGYAFTAGNTVPNATVGQGANVISGYTLSAVAYNLNATTPSNVDTVTFTISPATATSVKAQLTAAGPWYPCTNATGTVTCTTTGATALAATALNVVAQG